MKKTINLLIIISLGLFMNSCYYDSYPIYDDIDDGTGGGGEVPTEVSYSMNIQPLFDRCVGCHKGTNPKPDLREGTSYSSLVPSYVKAGDAAGSRLYNFIPGKGHFDVGFTLKTNELDLIKAWIDQGAKNN